MSANQPAAKSDFFDNLGPFVLFVALMFGLRWMRGDFEPKPELKLQPYLQRLHHEPPVWDPPAWQHEPLKLPRLAGEEKCGSESARLIEEILCEKP